MPRAILKLQPVFGPTHCGWDQCRAFAHKIINEVPYCPVHGSLGLRTVLGIGLDQPPAKGPFRKIVQL